MKRMRIMLFAAHAASLWFARAAPLEGVEHPYAIIADRNVFALRPIAVVAEQPSSLKTVAAQAPLFRLTGVALLDGKRWALFIKETRGQPPELLTLQEGGKAADVEVRDVDVENEQVRIIFNDRDHVLSFAAQGAEARAARQAEKQFVEEHTRAHEELQRRERARLARESSQMLRP